MYLMTIIMNLQQVRLHTWPAGVASDHVARLYELQHYQVEESTFIFIGVKNITRVNE